MDKITLAIDGFNSLGKMQTYDVVNFDVTTTDGLLQISAMVINSFPYRINMPGRSSLVKDLQNKGFILADPTSHTDNLNDVGILI